VITLLLGFVVAIGVTMALIPPLIKLAPRWHFVDLPQQRKVHANPIPRVGGIAMAIGVLLGWLVCGFVATQTIALVTGVLVLLAFGMWDDRVTLDAGPKFLGQTIAVLVVMLWGNVSIGSLTLVGRVELSAWIAAPLTFVFLVGATNAINLADGLDGLAGGTIMMCLAGLALLAFNVGSPLIGGLALLVIGAVLGFLRYNTYPARVFMGDSGSQILGFCAAVLSVMLTQDAAVPLSAALPLLLLGMPIIDTATVMTSRILSGQSPFKADRNHIHHRLLALGFDHHEAVMVIYFMQALLFLAAWFMRYDSDLLIVAAFTFFGAGVLIALRTARLSGWRWRDRGVGGARTSRLRRRLDWFCAPTRLPRWSFVLIACALACYASLILFVPSESTVDAGLLSIAAALILGCNLVVRWRETELGWVDKAALYLCTVLIVYLGETAIEPSYHSQPIFWGLVFAIAAAVAVRLRLQPDRRFVVTPLDVLVVIVALLVPNLPGSLIGQHEIGVGIIKLIVLFYGIETLIVAVGKNWKILSLAAWIVFTACATRGL
jgi:UDP-GlcNAc:undecaprenyl-phosphate GlcNAc-1-phosphate transferase